MNNVVKFEDGLTGYMNYGFWTKGEMTENPSGELVKAVLKNMNPRVKPDENGKLSVLEIGSGLGQPALDAAKYFGSFISFLEPLKSKLIDFPRQ